MSTIKTPQQHVSSALAHMTVAAEELRNAINTYGYGKQADRCEAAWMKILLVRDDLWAQLAPRWSMDDLTHPAPRKPREPEPTCWFDDQVDCPEGAVPERMCGSCWYLKEQQ